MKIHSIKNFISFEKKPETKIEKDNYKKGVTDGLALLNKDICLIAHNSTLPSKKTKNTGIGSIFNSCVNSFEKFLFTLGITGIQQEPYNTRIPGNNSPYSPLSEGKNIYMIPLEKLAGKKYSYILSQETLKKITHSVPKDNKVDYAKIEENYDIALREAFNNFKKDRTRYRDLLKYIQNLSFLAITKNPNLLDKMEYSAIFEILHSENKGKNWTDWNEIDKKLFCPKTSAERMQSNRRIMEIKTKYKDDFEFFYFKQYIIDKEIRDSNGGNNKIKHLSDSPVAMPAATEWAYQDLFLKDRAIGCPPDNFSADGQHWGFRYFKPEELFNDDGTLGRAGELLKEKYKEYFKTCTGGIRIDHALGLTDPYIYETNPLRMPGEYIMTPNGEKIFDCNEGRIYSAKKGEYAGKYTKKQNEFSNILEKIVFAAADECGVSKDAIICEDLGSVTKNAKRVFDELGTIGIKVTQYGKSHRGKVVRKNNVITPGTHDNIPYILYTRNLFNEHSKRFLQFAENLVNNTAETQEIKKEKLAKICSDENSFIEEALKQSNVKDRKEIAMLKTSYRKLFAEHSQDFMKRTLWLAHDTVKKGATKEEKKSYLKSIREDEKKFLEAAYTELFTSPAKFVQISFCDLWGMTEPYNVPGTNTNNWALRIPQEFENKYYERAVEGYAPNFPQVIANALRARGIDNADDILEKLDSAAKSIEDNNG